MAKAKVTKGTTGRSAKRSTSASRAKPAMPRKKVAKVVDEAKALAKSPAASEIIAATLVAAAAALRDPRRARALATEAADDLKQAAKKGVEGGALWQLALDVARSSIDTLGKGKSKNKTKAKKDVGKAKDKPKKAGKKK
jgi:hypothetical protein